MLDDIYKVITTVGEGLYKEKGSKFYAFCYPVITEEEVKTIMSDVKKKFFDARHHCYAFMIGPNKSCYRSSDDGEPSGTAGEPILNAIQKNNLNNVLIIVTRYFGGILLGAGGLIRAYSNSAIDAINSAGKIIKQPGMEVQVNINYQDNEMFKYYCEKNNIKIINADYTEKILYKVELSQKQYEDLLKQQKENNGPKAINIDEVQVICRKYVEKQI